MQPDALHHLQRLLCVVAQLIRQRVVNTKPGSSVAGGKFCQAKVRRHFLKNCRTEKATIAAPHMPKPRLTH